METKNLELSYHIVRRLGENGYDTVEKIKKDIEENGTDNLLQIHGFGKGTVNKIIKACSNIELEDKKPEIPTNTNAIKCIRKSDLKSVFIDFLIHNIFENENIVKCPLNDTGVYPVDDIIYNGPESYPFQVLYVNSRFLTSEFANYIVDNYDVIDWSNSPMRLLRYAIGMFKNDNVIEFKIVDSIYYAFNRWDELKNNNTYIKFDKPSLESLYGNNFDVVINYNLLDKVYEDMVVRSDSDYNANNYNKYNHSDRPRRNKLDIKTRTDSSSFIAETLKQKSHNKRDFIVPIECKNILGNKFLLTFLMVTRTNKNLLEFETSNILGTYQFERNDIENGELLVPDSCSSMKDFIKGIILHHLTVYRD